GAPTLHVGGWYDFLRPHVLRAYQGIAAGAARTGDSQTLVVGPWDHQSLFSHSVAGLELADLLVRYLERSLLGDEARTQASPGVRPGVLLYLMEGEHWLAFDRFPPEGSRRAEWFLDSGGRANTADGNGKLVPDAPTHPCEDTFVYDPGSPVPTVGGGVWPFPAAGLYPGAADQSGVEEREDVLVYTSVPLAEDVAVAGPVEAELWVSSSACATDYTAKLVDVDPGGVPRVVQDGIHRVRPGPADLREPTRVTIDLGAAGWCFRAGHRLRLEVSSSNFPKFDRHLNCPDPPGFATGGAAATQKVFHGGTWPSLLRMTVVPGRVLEQAGVDVRASAAAALPQRSAGRSASVWHPAADRRGNQEVRT
ncbi:MAG TPA: CocE/NonD family hydrolase, partial [Longimicrobiaceae bacterium]|nr:CocE/NonD family hydrolase [Longimicrobiaceae bacterium]